MARARKVSDEELVEMYLAVDEETGQWAMTMSDILRETGVYQPQVYMALDRLGMPRRSAMPERARSAGKTKYSLSDETVRRVATDYMMKNKTAKDIAEELGLSYGQVLRMLKDARVQVVPGRRARSASGVYKKVKEALLTEDKSLLEIAADTGVSLGVVEKEAKKLAVFKQLFRDTKWGKTEAMLEELMHRIRDEWGEEVAEKTYQGRLPGF
jgi:hypothetical protein